MAKQDGQPRVCGYCLAKYHIRLIKYSSMPCDIEMADKDGIDKENSVC